VVLLPSDYVAIIIAGAGAVMGTLAKRTIRVVGIGMVIIGLVGLAISHIYFPERGDVPPNSMGNVSGNSGIVTQGQRGNNNIQSK
jgi:predicted amidohydrolase